MAILPPLPNIPSGQEIYDMIMGKIEPDLVTANMRTLKEKYAHETEEQKKERARRYKKAFEKYHEEYGKYKEQLEQQLHTYHVQSRERIEDFSKQSEENALASLEEAINNL